MSSAKMLEEEFACIEVLANSAKSYSIVHTLADVWRCNVLQCLYPMLEKNLEKLMSDIRDEVWSKGEAEEDKVSLLNK